jgi:hypothetical protein
MKKEVKLLKDYILSSRSEDATDYLVEQFIRAIYGKFRKASEAEGVDIYVDGRLAVELKTKPDDWLSAFYQVQHYRKKGQEFGAFCVKAHKFVGLWKVNGIPAYAAELAKKADPKLPPNKVGPVNARKTNKGQQAEIINSAVFCITPEIIDKDSLFKEDIDVLLAEFVDALKNVESRRQQINPRNFIQKVEYLKRFFDDPMDAIHCFYTILNFWDATSIVPEPSVTAPSRLLVAKDNGRRMSESFDVSPRYHREFRKFIENHYVFTNEGSGLTVDYYFSRFDEVLTQLKPEYAKQHGIFFTDHNLCKFALWFVHKYYEKKLSQKYIILDPAAGSGNLVTSWRNHLKHKIVSELEPDLLKIIERRMKADAEQVKIGFTIVPKTALGIGLNFIDKPAIEYFDALKNALSENNLRLNKPIAFLLNPPYKSTDENVSLRVGVQADYKIDPSIIKLTGKDAGKERYLAFLGQIVNISKEQVKGKTDLKPILMIFTPTSWLIPRPSYVEFREEFDKFFRFERGFIITGKEFFKIKGKFPISFTIWSYNYKENGNKNIIKLRDFSELKMAELESLNWELPLKTLDKEISKLIKDCYTVTYGKKAEDIKNWCGQKRYDFSRSLKRGVSKVGLSEGLAIGDPRRANRRIYGDPASEYIGFLDDCTPVRVKPSDDFRFNRDHSKSVWFRLDTDFKGVNKSKIFSGPTDNRSYCAYDLVSAKKTFIWYALTKALSGRYPTWANQLDIWVPDFKSSAEDYFYSLCFAFGLANNGCVVTKFEADNPVPGAPEVFVGNPLCPSDPDSFWSRILDPEVVLEPSTAAGLVASVKALYDLWGRKYCPQPKIEYVGLREEPYFKYFDYPDFITPYSGLVQIRKYADLQALPDLDEAIKDVKTKTKTVFDTIYSLLVDEFLYFDR